ncbi:glycoside hydrolase family 28 protein [Sphingomonas sp. JC676]|uniref:glycoside hydrolase family 28 protein n=1 Tax=Sphingomonas sp. JC676 TaxID=2768065 RepID=UPI001CA7AA00|nr:glycosyl hydrolase family 28 protein [Sphingomonas sp. JC676]
MILLASGTRAPFLDRRTILAGMAGLLVARPAFSEARFDAASFGAVGNGQTLSTRAIQAAIDAAAKAGGRVTLPPGTYLTGALFVKSGVTLQVDRGVTLLGSRDPADYPMRATRVAGIEAIWPAALVNIYREHDAHITGEGVIDGDGKVWWDAYHALRESYQPRGLRWAADYDCRRPRLIQLYEASNASVGGGLLLRRSGFWTVHVCYSRDIVVSDVTIRNNEDGRGPSTDGIDIDSSTRIRVERADIACNDDALCLKAGRDADGQRVNRTSTDVLIRDCTIRDAAAGITFGSETAGGFRNIRVERLRVLAPTPSGILFKSAHTRGGVIRDIVIDDIDMRGMKTAVRIDLNWNPSYSYARIPPEITDPPALWRVLAQPVPPERGLPKLEIVTIRRIRATDTRRAFDVAAYPKATLDHFRFDDIAIDAADGGAIADARDWRFTRTRLAAKPALRDSSGITGL